MAIVRRTLAATSDDPRTFFIVEDTCEHRAAVAVISPMRTFYIDFHIVATASSADQLSCSFIGGYPCSLESCRYEASSLRLIRSQLAEENKWDGLTLAFIDHFDPAESIHLGDIINTI